MPKNIIIICAIIALALFKNDVAVARNAHIINPPGNIAMEVFREWRSRVRVEENQADTAFFSSVIIKMANEDQIDRQYLWLADQPVSPKVREAAKRQIWTAITAADAAHTEQLKSLIPSEGWFRDSRDGDTITHAAWLILQHSNDISLMNRVLSIIDSRLGGKDVNSHDYALLSDRIAVYRGEPQRFGSQAICSHARPRTIEMYKPLKLDVDKSRSTIGWNTLYAETKADLKVGAFCG